MAQIRLDLHRSLHSQKLTPYTYSPSTLFLHVDQTLADLQEIYAAYTANTELSANSSAAFPDEAIKDAILEPAEPPTETLAPTPEVTAASILEHPVVQEGMHALAIEMINDMIPQIAQRHDGHPMNVIGHLIGEHANVPDIAGLPDIATMMVDSETQMTELTAQAANLEHALHQLIADAAFTATAGIITPDLIRAPHSPPDVLHFLGNLPRIMMDELDKQGQVRSICRRIYGIDISLDAGQVEKAVRLPCGYVFGDLCLRLLLSPRAEGGWEERLCPLCRAEIEICRNGEVAGGEEN